MKHTQSFIVIGLCIAGGVGVTGIWSYFCDQDGSPANTTLRSMNNGAEDRGDVKQPIPKRLAEALSNPRVAIEELKEKYRNVAIGSLRPNTSEYQAFNGDCYLLGALDLEEADDLLADWFARADQGEASLMNPKGGSFSSIVALIEIRRPREVVVDRILVSAEHTDDPAKLYSWSVHLALKFYRNEEVLRKLDKRIAASEGRTAGRYRYLRSAVENGPYGPSGPGSKGSPDSR